MASLQGRTKRCAVHVAVVDHRIGAIALTGRQAGCASGSRDYTRTHVLAQFDRCQSDTTGRTQYQQRFASTQFGPILQCMKGRAIGHAKGGSMVEIDARWQQQQVLHRDCDLAGKGAEGGDGRHRIAGLEAGDARTDRLHDAGQLGAGCERQRRLVLIFALDDQAVGKVHPGGTHRHHHLAFTRLWRGQVLKAQGLRRTVLAAQQCLH